MKQITLKQIHLANFRSFLRPTTITLSTTAGLKLISGDNRVEPRLGANGAGKSTIWDAVCFALYGASVKGLRAADLISYGQSEIEVALFLDIDGTEVLIHRTAPPNRIYIDDDQAEQADVERLIGLSKPRFLNAVLFGQATPLFIDLPVPARGDLLDEVLALEIWLQAADLAAERHREHNNNLERHRQQMQFTLGQLEGLGDITRLQTLAAEWDEAKRLRLLEVIARFEALEGEYNALDQQREIPVELIDERRAKQDYDIARQAQVDAQANRATVKAELDIIGDTILFFRENDVCPTCDQPITEAHGVQYNDRIKPAMTQLERDLARLELDVATTLDSLVAHETTWRGAMRLNQEKRLARTLLDAQIATKSREMVALEAEASRLNTELNPYSEQERQAIVERARLQALYVDQQAAEQELISQAAALEFWRQGFRRVRLFCLERVLAELTIETRNSLLALGLVDWGIVFRTATETRSGTLKLGVQIEVRSPTANSKFDMMSGGESQRARLAVSLGLANLIQRWAGVRYDFEVFDEPTAWLSERGVEDLLESLRTRAEINNRSIWLCDHRALAASGFVEQVNVVKDASGSYIA